MRGNYRKSFTRTKRKAYKLNLRKRAQYINQMINKMSTNLVNSAIDSYKQYNKKQIASLNYHRKKAGLSRYNLKTHITYTIEAIGGEITHNEFFIYNTMFDWKGAYDEDNIIALFEQGYIENWISTIEKHYGLSILNPKDMRTYLETIGVITLIPYIGWNNSTKQTELLFSREQDKAIDAFVEKELEKWLSRVKR